MVEFDLREETMQNSATAANGSAKAAIRKQSPTPHRWPSTAELEEVMENALTAPMIAGQDMFLLSNAWYQRWLKWMELRKRASPGQQPLHSMMDASMDGSGIGSIDNGILLERADDGEWTLKSGLCERTDYFLVDESSWKQLCALYGLAADHHEIRRRVISDGGLNPQPRVEVYPKVFSVFRYGDPDTVKSASISGDQTVQDLLDEIRHLLTINDDEVRIWGGPSKDALSQFRLYESLTETISLSGLNSDTFVMIEVKDAETGEWPSSKSNNSNGNALDDLDEVLPIVDWVKGSPVSSVMKKEPLRLAPLPSALKKDDGFKYSLNSSSSNSYSRPVVKPRSPGLVGLYNLGNTCFMNSALQCLSNTVPLLDYFLSLSNSAQRYSIIPFVDGRAQSEINRDNPLGMGGKMAVAFGSLLRQMWHGSESVVTPRDLKITVSHFAPQFSGYQQHDSQELTGFLLDALHEDLNRIIKKPYVEFPDNDGSIPEADFAEKLWNIHKARNDSVIVDHFQGQLKSTLVCPECSKVSVTFDPFMYMSLPLPVTRKCVLKFAFVPYKEDQPISQHQLQLDEFATIGRAKQAIAERLHCDAKKVRYFYCL